MHNLYVSLTGPLLGCYLKVVAEKERDLRIALNYSKLKHLWCSIYNEEDFLNITCDWNQHIIPCRLDSLPIDWHEYQKALGNIE